MKYEQKYKIDVNDKTTQAICEAYIDLKKEGRYIEMHDLYRRLKKSNIVVEDYDFLKAVIEYLELGYEHNTNDYGYFLGDIPESTYNWKRQKMTSKEFQVFLCKISNLAFHFARKDIIPNISNKFILSWRYQYESFTGYKLNKDKIGYMVKVLNEAGLTDITKSKQRLEDKWSTLHTVVLGKKHPFYDLPLLNSDDSSEVRREIREGIITDYNNNKPMYDMWYSYWLENRAFGP